MGEVKSTNPAAVFQLTSKAVNACSELHGVTLKLKNPPEELVNLNRDLAALIKLLANLQNALEPIEAQNIVDRDDGVRGALED